MNIEKIKTKKFKYHEKDFLPLEEILFLYKNSGSFCNQYVTKTIAIYKDCLVMTRLIDDKIYFYNGSKCIELSKADIKDLDNNKENDYECGLVSIPQKKDEIFLAKFFESFREENYIDCIYMCIGNINYYVRRYGDHSLLLDGCILPKNYDDEPLVVFNDPTSILGDYTEVLCETIGGEFDYKDLLECINNSFSDSKEETDSKLGYKFKNDNFSLDTDDCESLLSEIQLNSRTENVHNKLNENGFVDNYECHNDDIVDNDDKYGYCKNVTIEIGDSSYLSTNRKDYMNNSHSDADVEQLVEDDNRQKPNEDLINKEEENVATNDSTLDSSKSVRIRFGFKKNRRLTYREKYSDSDCFSNYETLFDFLKNIIENLREGQFDFVEIYYKLSLYLVKSASGIVLYFHYEFNPAISLDISTIEKALHEVETLIK